MNVGLGWFGVAAGAIGCVAMYVMAGGGSASVSDEEWARRRRFAWLCAGVTAVLTLVFWAIAMQRQEPFSSGQGLAFGFLIGGISGAIAIFLTFRLSQTCATSATLRSTRLCTLSSLFFGLFAVSLTYLIFAADPTKPLIGFSIGAAMAAILHTYVQYVRLSELPIRTEIWSVFAITVAAAIILAVEHFDATQLRMWWPLPILIATTALVASYVGIEMGSMGSLSDGPGKSYAVSVLVAAGILLALAAVYSWKLYAEWQLLTVTAAGLGIGATVAWLLSRTDAEDGVPGALEAGAAVVVLVVAFVVVAFKLWSGLGVAIGLLSAWVVAIPALAARQTEPEWSQSVADAAGWPLVVGLAMVLFRLYVQLFRTDLRGTDLGIHYTFIGAMLGALLPFALVAGAMRMRGTRDLRQGTDRGETRSGAIPVVIGLGFFTAASPLALVVLWGLTCALGYVFGLTAAIAFMLLSQLAYGGMKSGREAGYAVGLLVIGGQLTALAFAGALGEMELTRAVRIWVLAGISIIAIVWFALSSILSARAVRAHLGDQSNNDAGAR